MTCPYRFNDGAYVLAALSPGERADFEQHLTTCAACTAAVRELAPLPGLLGRVDQQVVEQDLPGSSPLPRLMDAAAATRRRRARVRRWRLAAVALAAAAAAAAGVSYWPAPPDGGGPVATPPMAEMRSVVEWSPVSAEVGLTDHAGGTGVAMRCHYGLDYTGPPRTFRLVAVGADGSDEQVGSWLAGPGDEIEMTGVTRFVGPELRQIELRDEGGTTLLVHRP